MGRGTAQGFIVNIFADCGLNQVTSGKEYASGTIHDQGFITHDRKIGPACHTAAHDGGNLWYAHRTHNGIIPENAAEVLFVGEDFVLHGQENACRINQVYNGDAVFHGNFLGPEILFCRNRKPGSCLYGSVVGNNHAGLPADPGRSGNYTPCRTSALLIVHLIARPQTDFIERAPLVDERMNALPGCHLSFLMLFFRSPGPAAGPYFILLFSKAVNLPCVYASCFLHVILLFVTVLL